MAMEPKKYMGVSRKKKGKATVDKSKIAKNPNKEQDDFIKSQNALNEGGPQLVEPSVEEKEMLAAVDAQEADRNTPKTSHDFEEGSTITVNIPRPPKEAKKEVVKRKIVNELAEATPTEVKQAIVSSEPVTKEKMEEPKKKGLSEGFKRAITHLAPQALGMLVGGMIEGTDGAVEGYEKGRQVTSDMHNLAQQDIKMQTAQMNADTQRMFAEAQQKRLSQGKKSKQVLSKTWVDAEGRPVIEKDGIPVDRSGNPISTENLKRYEAPLSPVERAKIENYQDISENRKFRQRQMDEGDAQRALKDLRSTERYKTSEKMLSGAPTVRNLIKDANINGGQSLAMLGPKVARSIAGEVGVLTDADVTRYVKDPSLVGGLRDSLKKLKSGKMSDVTAENLERLIDVMEVAAQDQIEIATDREAKLFSRRSGLSYDQARSMIDANASVGRPKTPTTSKVNSLFSKYKK